ncbi:uncharacterized protein LOC110708251 [Chenopodium quinoa]|uniref:uncharacterized protein LOC110708251 n=1 Tax=Chenopodium quinoa TaxID=63459 RepID=UPI000B78F115|nr:uncharacterized protein LOC110708251 [Chenopodium quinoa]
MSALKDSVVASKPDKSDESPPKKRLRYYSSDSDVSDDEGSARDEDNFAVFRKMAKEVLKYYNSIHKDADYECVVIVAQSPYMGRGRRGYGVHMNFFARQKDNDSSPELFYADMFGCRSEREIKCCILNPSPISFDEFVPGIGPSPWVYHPPNVKCADCEAMAEVMAKYEFKDDDDDGIDMF